MATKMVELTGLSKFARVWPGQIDTKYTTPARGGNWSICLILEDEDVKVYNALGLKNKAVSETDITIAKLKRPNAKSFPDLGEVCLRRYERHNKLGNLGAPKVSGVPDGTLIGNGSLCKATIEVYGYTYEGETGFASRLVSVEVLDHVPYVAEVKDEDGPPVF